MKRLIGFWTALAVGFFQSIPVAAATEGSMSTATLVSLCSTKDADPDVRLRQYMRCTDYLSGAIDVLRWVYFEKKVSCLPQGFTLGDLQGEVIAAEKHVPNPNDLGAAQFISFVMNLNHGCPLVPVLSFSD